MQFIATAANYLLGLPVLGWSDQDLGANLESFETERAAFLQRPSRGGAALEAAAD